LLFSICTISMLSYAFFLIVLQFQSYIVYEKMSIILEKGDNISEQLSFLSRHHQNKMTINFHQMLEVITMILFVFSYYLLFHLKVCDLNITSSESLLLKSDIQKWELRWMVLLYAWSRLFIAFWRYFFFHLNKS